MYQAMHIATFAESDMRPVEYQLFTVKTQLLNSTKNRYRAKLTIHDESYSERLPATNHEYNRQVLLDFDPTRHVFYRTQEHMARSFTVYSFKTQKETTLRVKETVPIIDFDKSFYYFIDGEWYSKSSTGKLYKQFYGTYKHVY